jgi:nucleotide-binding universal stress UspA family protein
MGSESTDVILVAIDGSQNSLVAAGVGARMASSLGARLGLIHVLDVPALNFWVGVESRMKEEIRTQAEATLTRICRSRRSSGS